MSRDHHEAADAEQAALDESVPSRGTLDVSLDDAFNAGSARTARRRISSGTMLLGLVVLIAGVSLWSMRIIDKAVASGPKMDRETESLLEAALKRGASAGAGADTPASMLLEPASEVDEVKVPLKDLAKNPFVIWRDVTDPPPPSPSGTGGGDGKQPTSREQQIAQWEADVDAAATIIKIQSTMEGPDGPNGPTGIANMNGHMMRVGDLFAVESSDIEFTIERIQRNEVTVRAYNSSLRHERLVVVKVNRKW